VPDRDGRDARGRRSRCAAEDGECDGAARDAPTLRIDRSSRGMVRLRTADSGTVEGDWTALVAGARAAVEFRLCGMAFVATDRRKARLKMEPRARWTLTIDREGRASGRAER
jgi:hypothetical protein